MRLRLVIFALLLSLLALPGFAGPGRDDSGPIGPTQRIIRLIKHYLHHLVQPLDDPYISPPRP